MRNVAVIGIGQTAVDEHWGKSLKDLAGEAVFSALTDAGRPGADAIYVGNMLSAMVARQDNLGAMVADWCGLWGTEAIKVEAACGSGGAAVRAAIHGIASGLLESAIVVGVEKMTETPAKELTSSLATAADADWEATQGLSFVAINALIMQRYLYEFGWATQDFAPFSINAHANGIKNPNARIKQVITQRDYDHARYISAPINLLDASPIGDGAAALYLVPAETVRKGSQRIVFLGSASATDTIAVHSRADLQLHAAELSARSAYNQAGISPKEIDFFEYHDAFSIMAALSLEAAGFARPGQGPRLGLDGEIGKDGLIPVATRGGLKSRGHPVGATGVYQIVEVVEQLRGIAGENQIVDASVGMAQNIGGSGATVFTHILAVN